MNPNRIDQFLESSGMSRDWVVPTALPTALKHMYPTDAHATGLEYADQIDRFTDWWNTQRNQKKAWIGITGSWRTINQQTVDDVADLVHEALDRDYGIVTGGALGMDYVASEVVIRRDMASESLRVILPVESSAYMAHYGHTADHTPTASGNRIDVSQGTGLASQIYYLTQHHPKSLFETDTFNEDQFMNPEQQDYRIHAYYFRNGLVAHACDGLGIFQVNKSRGVADTIMKTQLSTKPTLYGGPEGKGYQIDPDGADVIINYDTLAIPRVPDSYPIRRSVLRSTNKTSEQSN